MKKIFFMVCLLGCIHPLWSQDALLKIVKEELEREMEVLKTASPAPYFISYRVEESLNYDVAASFGALTVFRLQPLRGLTVQVRVGSPELDNFHILNHIRPQQTRVYALPMENHPGAIRRMLWRVTDSEYQQAVNQYNQVLSGVKVMASASDQSPDYTFCQPEYYYDPPLAKKELRFDKAYWENKMKTFSARFKSHPAILEASATINYQTVRKYFVSTKGTEIVENLSYVRMYMNAKSNNDSASIGYIAHRI